jgi:hypothetical protein
MASLFQEMTMKSRLLTASLALAGLGLAATAAHAGTDVYLSIGVPGYVQPQPYYVQPRPVYVQPQPYYVQPAPSYYYGQPTYYHRHGYQSRRYGPNGDLDRDGIRNRDDWDRDGDGIRNRHDRDPNNGWRY